MTGSAGEFGKARCTVRERCEGARVGLAAARSRAQSGMDEQNGFRRP